MLASMDFNGFHEISLEKYMKNNILLKFWSINDVTDTQKQTLLANITTATKKQHSWLAYDYLGLVGQWIGIPKLHNPWAKFCSEEVIALGNEPIFKPRKIELPPQASPTLLNTNLAKHQPPMKVFGYWLQD
jgi:hypothetical protein